MDNFILNKNYYVTYFDKNYAIKGITFLQSLFTHDPHSFVYVICLDNETIEILKKFAFNNIEIIPLEHIEKSNSEISSARKDRSLVEYYWTLTPHIINYVLVQLQENTVLTYIDSDMYFFNSPQIVFDELGNNDVYIHKHNFPKNLEHLDKYGIYNVGLMCFRHSEKGFKVLNWWQKKCLMCCKSELLPDDEVEYSFGDQKYLEYFEKLIDTVKVASSETIGVAPWNYSKYKITKFEGTILIDNQPLVLWHFHSLVLIATNGIIPHYISYPINNAGIEFAYPIYFEALINTFNAIKKLDKNFSYGFSPEKLSDGIYIVVNKNSSYNFNELGAKVQIEFSSIGQKYALFFLSKRRRRIRKKNKMLKFLISNKFIQKSFIHDKLMKLYLDTKYFLR